MENRLIPAFKRKYRGKKMILVMDNARYHNARGEDWTTPSDMNRGQCADFLRQIGVKRVRGEVRNHDRSFEASSFSKDERDGGPTLKLMREEMDKWLQSHPEANVEVPTQLVRDVRAGSRIIYTPPYESWLQPIELVWNQVKQQVAHGARKDRTTKEVEAATKAALQSIGGDRCTGTIDHVHRFIDKWLLTADAGWLGTFQSLDQLVAASAEERDAAYRRFMDGERHTGSNDSQKESQPSAAADDDSVGGRSKRRKQQGWHSTS